MKIAGINGSPRKGKNTAYLVEKALEGARAMEAETEMIDLVDFRIEHCNGCNHCVTHDECPIDDGMDSVVNLLLDADGIIIGTPVYHLSVSGLLKDFMDRSRYLKMVEFKMKNKVGGAIAVAGLRNGGQELALNALYNYFLGLGMIVVGPATDGLRTTMGGIGTLYKGIDPENGRIYYQRSSDDILAVDSCFALGKRVAEVAGAIFS
ncbi:MAG: flavodoxin family protein [Candidatus Thermoplasmatota archaeon]|nr:flavodoxin family protein [Candidatus Thermoplasmatota archaeon]